MNNKNDWHDMNAKKKPKSKKVCFYFTKQNISKIIYKQNKVFGEVEVQRELHLIQFSYKVQFSLVEV